jgi:DNA-binding transcriptional LysR family regulator
MWASAFQEAGFQPRVTQEATQVQTVLSLVKIGFGLALVPSSVTGHMPAGVKLKELKGLAAQTRMGIAVATRTDDNLPVVMAFLRVVEETTPLS